MHGMSSLARAAEPLFTGKPHVDGLGYAFLFRNYRPSLGKWLTADPLGYPDGWNQLAYCGNDIVGSIDFLGCVVIGTTRPAPGYESLPSEILEYTMSGFSVAYDQTDHIVVRDAYDAFSFRRWKNEIIE